MAHPKISRVRQPIHYSPYQLLQDRDRNNDPFHRAITSQALQQEVGQALYEDLARQAQAAVPSPFYQQWRALFNSRDSFYKTQARGIFDEQLQGPCFMAATQPTGWSEHQERTEPRILYPSDKTFYKALSGKEGAAWAAYFLADFMLCVAERTDNPQLFREGHVLQRVEEALRKADTTHVANAIARAIEPGREEAFSQKFKAANQQLLDPAMTQVQEFFDQHLAQIKGTRQERRQAGALETSIELSPEGLSGSLQKARQTLEEAFLDSTTLDVWLADEKKRQALYQAINNTGMAQAFAKVCIKNGALKAKDADEVKPETTTARVDDLLAGLTQDSPTLSAAPSPTLNRQALLEYVDQIEDPRALQSILAVLPWEKERMASLHAPLQVAIKKHFPDIGVSCMKVVEESGMSQENARAFYRAMLPLLDEKEVVSMWRESPIPMRPTSLLYLTLLVGRKQGAPVFLHENAGKFLGRVVANVAPGHDLFPFLKEHFPKIIEQMQQFPMETRMQLFLAATSFRANDDKERLDLQLKNAILDTFNDHELNEVYALVRRVRGRKGALQDFYTYSRSPSIALLPQDAAVDFNEESSKTPDVAQWAGMLGYGTGFDKQAMLDALTPAGKVRVWAAANGQLSGIERKIEHGPPFMMRKEDLQELRNAQALLKNVAFDVADSLPFVAPLSLKDKTLDDLGVLKVNETITWSAVKIVMSPFLNEPRPAWPSSTTNMPTKTNHTENGVVTAQEMQQRLALLAQPPLGAPSHMDFPPHFLPGFHPLHAPPGRMKKSVHWGMGARSFAHTASEAMANALLSNLPQWVPASKPPSVGA